MFIEKLNLDQIKQICANITERPIKNLLITQSSDKIQVLVDRNSPYGNIWIAFEDFKCTMHFGSKTFDKTRVYYPNMQRIFGEKYRREFADLQLDRHQI